MTDVKGLYTESVKYCLIKLEKIKRMQAYVPKVDGCTQYCKDINSPHIDLQSQFHPNQIFRSSSYVEGI